MKPKKCKSCKELFTPGRPMQSVCTPLCALELSKKKRERAQQQEAKQERKVDRERKDKLKTRGDWMKEAQAAFNAFIRARDRSAGHPCISSGRALDWSGNQVDAGHFRSVGSAPHLRFAEANCHAQSKHDNQYLSGNAVEYRRGLIERIGLESVETIEADNTPRKYTIEDL
uniref:recombination protein NinG n=1 Tax=Chryseobacterium sp. TaxID=1871047 RepID=UPI00321BFF92